MFRLAEARETYDLLSIMKDFLEATSGEIDETGLNEKITRKEEIAMKGLEKKFRGPQATLKREARAAGVPDGSPVSLKSFPRLIPVWEKAALPLIRYIDIYCGAAVRVLGKEQARAFLPARALKDGVAKSFSRWQAPVFAKLIAQKPV